MLDLILKLFFLHRKNDLFVVPIAAGIQTFKKMFGISDIAIRNLVLQHFCSAVHSFLFSFFSVCLCRWNYLHWEHRRSEIILQTVTGRTFNLFIVLNTYSNLTSSCVVEWKKR